MADQTHPNAGKTLDPSLLVNLPRLVTSYFTEKPDPAITAQRVTFGTSGHRGSALHVSFNENHILAVAQAICLYRAGQGINGPLFIGIDSHALSEPAMASALEVFAANEVTVMIDAASGYTPTPAVSHAILTYNLGRTAGLADGVVITPSHNPPEDGGFKYNGPNGGPADTAVTAWIEKTANDFLAANMAGVKRIPYGRALQAATTHRHDYISAYVADLANVLNMDAIRESGVKIGIDPLGGAAVAYWQPIIERYKLNASIVSTEVDQTFRFMTADWDGRIRMDCSSPYAMRRLVGMRDQFDVAFANDTDADRHGIVAKSVGLMDPNHYLAASISYLFANRPGWSAQTGIGKTMVSSSIIDRLATKIGRRLYEVPVGFKWFVDGLTDGSLGFVGEESAGAAFLRRDGSVWTTDKDGLIMGLLAAEMTAVTGRDPGEIYAGLTAELGAPFYERIDAPANASQKAKLKSLTPAQVKLSELGGEAITAMDTVAPGNKAGFGGLKVSTQNGWFAARPSGTEDVYKIYAESFLSRAHLGEIQAQAKAAIAEVFAG